MSNSQKSFYSPIVSTFLGQFFALINNKYIKNLSVIALIFSLTFAGINFGKPVIKADADPATPICGNNTITTNPTFNYNGESIVVGNNLYVSDSAKISVIDVTTNSIITTIPLPKVVQKFYNINGKIYAVTNGSGYGESIVIINPTTNTISNTITLPGGSFNQKQVGSKIYIPYYLTGNIQVFDTVADTITSTFNVGGQPTIFAEVGGKLYINDNDGYNIKVLDTNTNNVIASIYGSGTIKSATQVGTKLFLNDESWNAVKVIETSNNTRLADIAIGTTQRNSTKIGDNVYVLGGFNQTNVYIIDGVNATLTSTNFISNSNTNGGGNIRYINGKLFIDFYYNQAIGVVDQITNTISKYISIPYYPGQSSVTDNKMYVSSGNKVYVVDMTAEQLIQPCPVLGSAGSISGNVGQPVPIIQLYGNTVANNTLATYTPQGSSTAITGKILNNTFVPDPNQTIPSGTVLGDNTGTLASIGIASIIVPGLFSAPLPPAPLTVTVNQSATQTDPSSNLAVNFTAVFSEPIEESSFDLSDIVISGTAPGLVIDSITQISPNDNTTFEIGASASGFGTVVVDIPVSQYSYGSSTLALVGTDPHGIAIDQFDNLYTANYTSSNITKILPNGTTSIVGTPGSPLGIAVDTAGNIYTANRGAYQIDKTTPAGITTAVVSGFNFAFNVAIDSLNNVYAVSPTVNIVKKISPTGAVTNLNISGTGPIDVVVGPDNSVYTVNQGSNNVTKISPSGYNYTLGTTGNSPQGIAVDTSNNVYTTNWADNTVTKITPSGVSTILGTTGVNPFGIITDQSGNVYTANYGSNNVTKITPSGVSTIIGTTGNNPRDIILDSTGNIYTTNTASNNVTKISKTIFVTGIKTLSGKGNKVSTSSDNSVTLEAGYTFGSYVGPLTGAIGASFPTIPLEGSDVPNNTVATLSLSSSTTTIQGVITGGNFVPNVGQTIPSDVVVGSSNGFLSSSNILDLVISTNFSSPVPPPIDPLTVSINQELTQTDPTLNSPVSFTAVFSEPIDATSFDASDIVLTGTATGRSVLSISEKYPNNSTTFEILVTATGPGTIIANIPAGEFVYDSNTFGPTGSYPTRITVDNADNVYVANYYGKTVTKLSQDGTVLTYGATGQQPNDIAVDTFGNVYTNAYSYESTKKITPDGTSISFGAPTQWQHSIAIDSNNTVYTTSGGTLSKTLPDGTTTLIPVVGGFVVEMGADSLGNLYLLNNNSKTITKVLPDGTSSFFATAPGESYNVEFDSNNNIYIPVVNQNYIIKFLPDGTPQQLGTLSSPAIELALDNEGNIYTVSFSGAISKIRQDGTTTIVGYSGLGGASIALDSQGNIYTSNGAADNITKLTKTQNFLTGIKTISGKTNQASTTVDNSVTLDVIYTLGAYFDILTGFINSFFPNFALTGSNVPDGTPATFQPAGSLGFITGIIQGGYFSNISSQSIPGDATTGPAIGTLSTPITPDINISTNFTTDNTTQEIFGNFSVPNPSIVSYDDNNDAVVRYELNFNTDIYVNTFTAEDVTFGFYQGCNVVLISPRYNNVYTASFDVVMNCGNDPLADGESVYPQIQPGSVDNGNLTNANIANRGTLAQLRYSPVGVVNINVPSIINSSNYTNFAITGSCVADLYVNIYINLTGETGTTTCQSDNTYSYIPEIVIYSAYQGCGVNYYDSCNYIATASQNLNPTQDYEVNTGSVDYGIFDNSIYGNVGVDNSTIVDNINYIFAQPNYFSYYCGDAQTVNISINANESFVRACESSSSIDFLSELPSPLVNGAITINGTSTDNNGNSQPINYTAKVCLDTSYDYSQPLSFFDYGSIKTAAQSAPNCQTIDSCTVNVPDSQYYYFLNFGILGKIKTTAQTIPDCCSSSSSSPPQILEQSGYWDFLGGIKTVAQTTQCSSSSSSISSEFSISSSAISSDSSVDSSSSSPFVDSSSSTAASSSISSEDISSSSSTVESSSVSSNFSSLVSSSSLSSEVCVIIVPLIPDCGSFSSLSSSSSSSYSSLLSDLSSSSLESLSSELSSSSSSDSCEIIVPLLPICQSSSSSISSSSLLELSSSSNVFGIISSSSDIASSSSSVQSSLQFSSAQISSSPLVDFSSSSTSSPQVLTSSSSPIISSQSSNITSSSTSSSSTIVVIVSSISSVSPSSIAAISSSSLASEDGDGVPAIVENLAPNNGDGNSDGVLDSVQSDVASVLDPQTDIVVTVEIEPNSVDINPCTTLQNVLLTKEIENQKIDEGYEYPAGFVNFESNCPNSLRVKIYWYGLDLTQSYVNRKFRSNGQYYDFVDGVTTTIETINSQNVMTFTYTVDDNGTLDEDPAIGRIKDPIGPAIALVGNSGSLVIIESPKSKPNNSNFLSQPSIIQELIQPKILPTIQNSIEQPIPQNTQNSSTSLTNIDLQNITTIRTGGARNYDNLIIIILLMTASGISALSPNINKKTKN
jgi:hypothetical protein